MLSGLLDALSQVGRLHHAGDAIFGWLTNTHPPRFSLRSSSPEAVVLQSEEEGLFLTIGEVDRASAPWMVHPEAVYLHAGQSFLVEDLDLENHLAQLKRQNSTIYTDP